MSLQLSVRLTFYIGLLSFVALYFLCGPVVTVDAKLTIDPVIQRELTAGNEDSCPTQEERNAVHQNITNTTLNLIYRYICETGSSEHKLFCNCGPGEWHQLASLNMSDPSQQCPSPWTEYNSGGVRACQRSPSTSPSCSGVLYSTPTNYQYKRVCGRATGYQFADTDAFHSAVSQSLDSYYVYGVSFTHGSPRNHIWTLAAGLTEGNTYGCETCECPCINPTNPSNAVVPSYIGDNYYCESGNPTSTFIVGHLYNNDPLWDGDQCESQCCSDGKSPPWFSVELPNPTSDDIEVRICNPEDARSGTPVQLLELYVQ